MWLLEKGLTWNTFDLGVSSVAGWTLAHGSMSLHVAEGSPGAWVSDYTRIDTQFVDAHPVI